MADEASRTFTSGGLAGPLTTNLPQPRDVALPDFTSDTYVAVNGMVTGDIANTANMLPVWSPRGTRFVLRGGYLHILCISSLLGPGAAGELWFFDELVTQPVLPITSFHGTGTLINWVNSIEPWDFNLGKGYRSRAKNNRLLIGGTISIGGGQLYCTGLLWGVQDSL